MPDYDASESGEREGSIETLIDDYVHLRKELYRDYRRHVGTPPDETTMIMLMMADYIMGVRLDIAELAKTVQALADQVGRTGLNPLRGRNN